MKLIMKNLLFVFGVMLLITSCKKSHLKPKHMDGQWVCQQVYDPHTGTYKVGTFTLDNEERVQDSDRYNCTWELDGYSPVETTWAYIGANEQQVSGYRNSSYIDDADYQNYTAYLMGITLPVDSSGAALVNMCVSGGHIELFRQDGETFFLGFSGDDANPYKFVKQ